jgi:threonine dehydrogenase-like Zn-dependent dehydrogenase
VRLEGCGICSSNLALWEGRPWFEYPHEAGSPGHEGWGRVDCVGPGVNDLDEGERVAIVSAKAYAEYDVVPRALAVRLGPELDALPFPGEPLGCAMNIFERSDIRAGHSVAIVGLGFLGIVLTQLASAAGAYVVGLSRRQYALDFALRMGARHVVQVDRDSNARGAALAIVGGRGYDRVIEAGGVQSTLDLASALTAEYGRLVIAGYHQDGLREVNMQQWNWRALEVINAHERAPERYVSGIERAVRAVMDGRLDPFPLFTHEVSLETLDRGFELTRARPQGFMKAVVRIGSA